MENKIFDAKTGVFTLETLNTAYALKIVSGKYVVHLYYGEKNGIFNKFYCLYFSNGWCYCVGAVYL